MYLWIAEKIHFGLKLDQKNHVLMASAYSLKQNIELSCSFYFKSKIPMLMALQYALT